MATTVHVPEAGADTTLREVRDFDERGDRRRVIAGEGRREGAELVEVYIVLVVIARPLVGEDGPKMTTTVHVPEAGADTTLREVRDVDERSDRRRVIAGEGRGEGAELVEVLVAGSVVARPEVSKEVPEADAPVDALELAPDRRPGETSAPSQAFKNVVIVARRRGGSVGELMSRVDDVLILVLVLVWPGFVEYAAESSTSVGLAEESPDLARHERGELGDSGDRRIVIARRRDCSRAEAGQVLLRKGRIVLGPPCREGVAQTYAAVQRP